MPDREERPAGALAHGAVKSSDIERVRRNVDKCDARAAHDDQAIAARREQRLRRRAAKPKQAPKP
jgi:hypothetical protein